MLTFLRTSLLALCLVVLLAEQGMAQEVKSQEKPLRIIALAPHIVEMLYEIGAGELIIGTTDHADFPEQAKEIPLVGNYSNLNVEQILSLDPDLIIAWKTGNPSEDLARLAKMGIKIVHSEPKVLEDVATEVIKFGKITGNEVQAERVAQAFLKKLSGLKALYQDKAPISIFFELWSRPLTTVARNSWPQQQLAICKADNLFIDSLTDYPQISVEDVVLKGPEIIIQPSSMGKNSGDAVNWRQWETIPAVKANAFLSPDANKVYRMSSRVLDELTLLCAGIERYRAARN